MIIEKDRKEIKFMIEKNKKDYKNIKKNITAEEYIDDFRKSFKIVQDEKVNSNFLKELYYEFIIHTFKQSKLEQFIISKLADLEADLIKSFNDTQKGQLKIYDYLHNEMSEIQGFTSFIYGFCVANELNKTTDNFLKDDKILNEIINKLKTLSIKGGEDIND